ncbi:MAG: DUF444 family protein [Planctomycetes bacterium]|nr:DUF444 family protein [Planctomycetota bacterium]
MAEDKISSNESEGAFNEFIEEQIEEVIDGILNNSDLENLAGRGSDIVVEVDGIEPPQFVHEEPGEGGGGSGGAGPGSGGGKVSFTLPFNRLMELIGQKLRLPFLTKQGEGKIKELSYEYKTFGPVGVLLDKRRTFRRALKTSIALGEYAPEKGKHEVRVMRRDKRFKQFEEVEKPKFRAVVFYMGDISYSTYGERIEMEKRMVSFIQNWLDYNYGAKNVEHRFFVHDAKAYEVNQGDFFNVGNAGGTQAAPVFDLVSQIALSEYDPGSTNMYAFYFGDGELFQDDPQEIQDIIGESMRPYFNRIGIVEVKPSSYSNLVKKLKARYANDSIVRLAEMQNKSQTTQVIKNIFAETHA